MRHVGQRLKTLLGQKGISQVDLATKINRHSQNINRLLLRQSMTTDLLQEIMAATGIMSWEIFEQDNPQASLHEEMLADKRRIIQLQAELDECRSKKTSRQE